jgi:hypothetical protein
MVPSLGFLAALFALVIAITISIAAARMVWRRLRSVTWRLSARWPTGSMGRSRKQPAAAKNWGRNASTLAGAAVSRAKSWRRGQARLWSLRWTTRADVVQRGDTPALGNHASITPSPRASALIRRSLRSWFYLQTQTRRVRGPYGVETTARRQHPPSS